MFFFDTDVKIILNCNFLYSNVKNLRSFGKSTFGWQDDSEIQRKSDQIYNILVSHYSEIVAMREQVQLIKGFLAA